MTDTSLKQTVEDTIKWANELNEIWVGTTTGRIIEAEKDHLKYLARVDMNLASVQVLELVKTLQQVEKESNGY